jgi:hypothetical protein
MKPPSARLQFGASLLVVMSAMAGVVAAQRAWAQPPPPPPPIFDLFWDCDYNGNGRRDQGDLALFMQYWADFHRTGQLTTESRRADLNQDGVIDCRDARLLVEEWLNPVLRDLPLPPGAPASAH